MNINPAIGYRINDQFSVGAGINYQKMDAELSQVVDYAMICTVASGGALSGLCGAGAGTFPGTNDGRAKVTADDTAWGFNAGLLWQLQTQTRLGAAYRSKIQHSLTGDFDVTAPSSLPAPALAALQGGGLRDSGANAYVDLPATLSLSAHHQINPAWAVMGDVTRTFWSDLPELRISFDSGQDDSVVTLDLKDVNRYSVGVTYTPGSAWTYRAGVALDQTPTPNETARTPRLPDEDRLWLAFGAGYKYSDSFSVDLAYAYLKINDASVNKSVSSTSDEDFLRGNFAANYESKTQILSAQGRWTFK